MLSPVRLSFVCLSSVCNVRAPYSISRDIAQYFLNRVINRWNAVDHSAVDAPSINAFKQTLVKVRNNRVGFFVD